MISMVTITLPTPTNFLEITWLGIGLTFGRSFGNIDHQIQQSQWFLDFDTQAQYIIKFLLNFLHHWWIGALLMIYFPENPAVYYFAFGVLIDDLPDIPPRVRKMIGWMFTP